MYFFIEFQKFRLCLLLPLKLKWLFLLHTFSSLLELKPFVNCKAWATSVIKSSCGCAHIRAKVTLVFVQVPSVTESWCCTSGRTEQGTVRAIRHCPSSLFFVKGWRGNTLLPDMLINRFQSQHITWSAINAFWKVPRFSWEPCWGLEPGFFNRDPNLRKNTYICQWSIYGAYCL